MDSWKKIIVSAVIAGVITLGVTMLTFYLQQRQPHLAYTITPTIPFVGTRSWTAIYQISLLNDGRKEAESVDCFVRVPGAKIVDNNVSRPAALKYTVDTPSEDALGLHLPGLNQKETVGLAVLATGENQIKPPSRPEVSVRAKDATGEEREAIASSTTIGWGAEVSGAVGLITALATGLYGAVKKALTATKIALGVTKK